MRDKIFETSASLSPTDNRAILDAKEAGSSVALSWTAWIVILIVMCAATAVVSKVVKKDDKAGGASAPKK